MSPDEARTFAQGPWANDAVALRRWDNRAKIPGLEGTELDHYSARITQLLA